MSRSLMNRPVTIVQRTAGQQLDDYGTELVNEEDVSTVGNLQQKSRQEPVTAGELSITEWLLFLPAGTEIDVTDGVLVDGGNYEVIGEPWHVRRDRNGRESHVEVTLRRAGEGTGS